MLFPVGNSQIHHYKPYLPQEQDKGLTRAFRDRSIDDGRLQGWNRLTRVGSRSGGHVIAQRSRCRAGLWQLRGDRISGLDDTLAGSEDLNNPAIRVKFMRSRMSGYRVWDFAVEHMPSNEDQMMEETKLTGFQGNKRVFEVDEALTRKRAHVVIFGDEWDSST